MRRRREQGDSGCLRRLARIRAACARAPIGHDGPAAPRRSCRLRAEQPLAQCDLTHAAAGTSVCSRSFTGSPKCSTSCTACQIDLRPSHRTLCADRARARQPADRRAPAGHARTSAGSASACRTPPGRGQFMHAIAPSQSCVPRWAASSRARASSTCSAETAQGRLGQLERNAAPRRRPHRWGSVTSPELPPPAPPRPAPGKRPSERPLDPSPSTASRRASTWPGRCSPLRHRPGLPRQSGPGARSAATSGGPARLRHGQAARPAPSPSSVHSRTVPSRCRRIAARTSMARGCSSFSTLRRRALA